MPRDVKNFSPEARGIYNQLRGDFTQDAFGNDPMADNGEIFLDGFIYDLRRSTDRARLIGDIRRSLSRKDIADIAPTADVARAIARHERVLPTISALDHQIENEEDSPVAQEADPENKLSEEGKVLRTFRNPSVGLEAQDRCKELTFLGEENQPDYAMVVITSYPVSRIIDLRSLKLYYYAFREKLISYEGLLDRIYTDVKIALRDSERVRVAMCFNVRGGIDSIRVKDSDWPINGGQNKFKEWADSQAASEREYFSS